MEGAPCSSMNIDLVYEAEFRAQGYPPPVFRDVWASQNKQARADNPALQYELGQVFHAQPMPALEDQLCTWIPGEGPSPDRLDALVHAIRSLEERRFRIGGQVVGSKT